MTHGPNLGLSTVDLKTGSASGELDLNSSDLTSLSNSQAALTKIDGAIGQLNTYIGKIGAAQNRVDYAQTNLKTSIQNFLYRTISSVSVTNARISMPMAAASRRTL